MEFLSPSVAGRPGPVPGSIDYRLARRQALRRFRAGEVGAEDICDAQAELLRVAHSCSEPAGTPCPVCRARSLRNVRFVFGPRLPPGGRAVSSHSELDRLAGRSGEHRCYLVEVCIECRWNHLLSTTVLGAGRTA